MGGGWFVRRLISQSDPLRAEWKTVAKRLIEQMQIGQAIRWLQSSRIQVPQVVGWWMPVILVPTSIFSTLTPREIECLLLHELAHIRRHDYAINLFQCLIETFFFFHPSVWWLSQRIRLERELACDETVVNITGDPLAFSRALLALADLVQLPQPTLAATESDLTKRVHSILKTGRAGKSQSWAVLICVTVCMFAVGAVILMNQSTEQPDPGSEPVTEIEKDRTIKRFVKAGLLVPDLSGVIVDELGKPIPDAVVTLRQNGRGWRSSGGGPTIWKDLARTKSDSQGRFLFTEVFDSKTIRQAPSYDIVTFKENYALGWKHVQPKKTSDKLKITLKQPVNISGRVVDEFGKPVSGAKVLLKHLMSIRHITQADLEIGRWPSYTDSTFVSLHGFREPLSTTTDAEGRFQLSGAVANSGVFLEVAHPEHLIKNAFAATVVALDPATASKTKRDVQTGEMSIALKRGYRLKIRVLDDNTGKPVFNVRYAPVHGTYHTPPRGRSEGGTIQIDHLPSPEFLAIVYPPENSDYLACRRHIEWPIDQYVREVDVRLKKGIPVRGQVTDEKDQGIASVEVFVNGNHHELPHISNRQHLIPAQPFVTDTQGRFTAYLIPGDYTFSPRGRIRGFMNARDTSSSKKIVVTKTGVTKRPVLKLVPAPRFQLVVTDPNGNPAPNVDIFAQAYSSLNSYFPIRATTNKDGKYLLDQLFMNKAPVQDIFGEEVIFRDRENNLGARLIFQRPQQDEPVEQTVKVRLKKLGTVVGRTVSAETGKPISGTSLWLYKQDHIRNIANATGESTTTGADGRFELKGVLPDIEHHLSMRHTRFKVPNGIKTRFKMTASEAFDFGDIKLGPLTSPASANTPLLVKVVAPDVDTLSPEKAFQQLESTYKTVFKSYRDKYKELRKQYSSEYIVLQLEPTPSYCKAFLKLANRDPESDIALKSYLWIVTSRHVSGSEKKCRAFRAEATEAIVAKFLDRPEIASCIRLAVNSQLKKTLKYAPSDNDRLIAAAEKLMKRNQHREVHARACYYLVERLMNSLLGRLPYQQHNVSPETVAQCRHYLERLKKEFPEYDHFLYGTYGKAAERLLYDIDHLLVGKTPPELAGTDVTGMQVKLSDFRGKFVIVDFWQGVGPVTSGHDSLKHIMDKADDRVAVFGVVSSSRKEVLAEVEKYKMNYPVFADGRKGPFFTKWNIHTWPTTILLDEQGTILYRGQRGTALENILIEKLAEKTP